MKKFVYKDLNKIQHLCIPEINHASRTLDKLLKYSPQGQSVISLHFGWGISDQEGTIWHVRNLSFTSSLKKGIYRKKKFLSVGCFSSHIITKTNWEVGSKIIESWGCQRSFEFPPQICFCFDFQCYNPRMSI